VLYPAINETKKDALIGNFNSTYPVNKDFTFFLSFASDFALTHGGSGFNLPEIKKDKRSSAYAQMASVKQLMVRSITDWFRKFKARHATKNAEQIELQDSEDADDVSDFNLLEAFHMVDLSFL